jgi:hypothetical protein
MGRTLYLIETRAKYAFECPACKRRIPRGTPHFRHDPYPYDRVFRGHPTTHWCFQCITAAGPSPKDPIGRIRVPVVRVLGRPATHDENQLPLFAPLRIELVGMLESVRYSRRSSLRTLLSSMRLRRKNSRNSFVIVFLQWDLNRIRSVLQTERMVASIFFFGHDCSNPFPFWELPKLSIIVIHRLKRDQQQ